MRSVAVIIITAALTGCAGPATYRYANHILIPPGVKTPTVPRRSATVPVAAKCSASENGVQMKQRGGSVRVTVEPAGLLEHPAAWLSTWVTSLEKNGCLGVGDGATVATRVTEIVPLDPRAGYNLLHASATIDGYVDVGPENRLKVVAPIMREGAAPGASAISGPAQVSGEGGKINVAMRASKDLLGYETAWFGIQPLAGKPGSRVVFLSAEDNMDGKVSNPEKPRFDYFQFAPDSAFYRLFYLTRISRADHDLAVLAAPTKAELEDRTKRFAENPDVCATLGSCVLIPRESAVVPHILVMAAGKETAVVSGGTVRDALRAASVNDPAAVLKSLQVDRKFNGKPTPVEFDRTSQDILGLPLLGGEVIRW